MASRRRRKRERRLAEANANAPRCPGGWGRDASLSLSDLILLRQAINQNWPVPSETRAAIVAKLSEELNTASPRRFLSIAASLAAMDAANIRMAVATHNVVDARPAMPSEHCIDWPWAVMP